MNLFRIFVLAALVLVVFGIGNAEATEEKEPTWQYGGGGWGIPQITGESNHILLKKESSLLLFHVDSFTPIWQLTYTGSITNWDISDNGSDFFYLNHTHLSFNNVDSGESWNFSPPCYHPFQDNVWWECMGTASMSNDGRYISLITDDRQSCTWDDELDKRICANYNATLYVFDRNSNVPLWSYEFVNPDWNNDQFQACCRSTSYLQTSNQKVALQIDDYKPESTDTVLYQFNILNGNILGNYTYTGTGDYDENFIFSSDGNYVIYKRVTPSTRDYHLDLVDLVNFTRVWSIDIDNSHPTYDISSNGNYVVACLPGSGNDAKAQIQVFSKELEFPIWTYKIDGQDYKTTSCSDVEISNSGEYISVSYRFTNEWNSGSRLLFFDKDIPEPIWSYGKTDNGVSGGVAISENGKYTVVYGGGQELYLFVTQTNDYADCTHGQIKMDDDGFNQCICNNGGWLCTDVECTADISYNPENNDSMNEENDGTTDSTPCETGESKVAEDGCNQCVCNDGNWVCTEIDCANSEDEEGFLPSISLVTSLILVGLLAIYRRK